MAGLPGTRIPRMKLSIGVRNIKMGEVPPKVGKIRRNKMMMPYRFKNLSAS